MSFEEDDDDRDRLASLADCMLKRQPVALPPSTAPTLQVRKAEKRAFFIAPRLTTGQKL